MPTGGCRSGVGARIDRRHVGRADDGASEHAGGMFRGKIEALADAERGVGRPAGGVRLGRLAAIDDEQVETAGDVLDQGGAGFERHRRDGTLEHGGQKQVGNAFRRQHETQAVAHADQRRIADQCSVCGEPRVGRRSLHQQHAETRRSRDFADGERHFGRGFPRAGGCDHKGVDRTIGRAHLGQPQQHGMQSLLQVAQRQLRRIGKRRLGEARVVVGRSRRRDQHLIRRCDRHGLRAGQLWHWHDLHPFVAGVVQVGRGTVAR